MGLWGALAVGPGLGALVLGAALAAVVAFLLAADLLAPTGLRRVVVGVSAFAVTVFATAFLGFGTATLGAIFLGVSALGAAFLGTVILGIVGAAFFFGTAFKGAMVSFRLAERGVVGARNKPRSSLYTSTITCSRWVLVIPDSGAWGPFIAWS